MVIGVGCRGVPACPDLCCAWCGPYDLPYLTYTRYLYSMIRYSIPTVTEMPSPSSEHGQQGLWHRCNDWLCMACHR